MFDAALYAPGHDDVRQQQERRQVDERMPRIGDKAVEGLDEVRLALQPSEGGGEGVVERPSGHDGIEREDEEAAQYAHDACCHPGLAGCQLLESTNSVGVGRPSDDELAEHDGHRHQEDEPQIDQDEGSAAALSHFGRKTPDVAQPYGRTCRSQYDAKLTAKPSTFRINFSQNLPHSS